MTEKLSIDLLPPSAADAFRIGIEVSTVAWHYSQLLLPAVRAKHLDEVHHGLAQIEILCQARGAMPSEHEIALAIDQLKTWPQKYLDDSFIVEGIMDARYAWGCSEQNHSDLLVLAERLTDLTPPVELMMDRAIRDNLLRNCRQSSLAYDFGKCLDSGRHSRRLPESMVCRPKESSTLSTQDTAATDINLTDECPITDSVQNASTLGTTPSLVRPSPNCQRTLKSPVQGISQLPRIRRPIVPDNSVVVAAEPDEGEISPLDHWWTDLKVLAHEVGVPFVKKEPDNGELRCEFVKDIKQKTLASLETMRTVFGHWTAGNGLFQYLDGPPFHLPPRESRLLMELLKNNRPVTRERLMNLTEENLLTTKACNTAIDKLRSLLKQKLSEQMGKDISTIIDGSGRGSEFFYTFAAELR